MNGYIKQILGDDPLLSVAYKRNKLDALKRDLELAYKIMDGTYVYCPECDDYYLFGSFQTEVKQEDKSICVYEDPINSGGNEYVTKPCKCTYSIYPKNHKKLLSQVPLA